MVRTEPSRLQNASRSELQRRRDIDEAVRHYGDRDYWRTYLALTGGCLREGSATVDIRNWFRFIQIRRGAARMLGGAQAVKARAKTARLHAALAQVAKPQLREEVGRG